MASPFELWYPSRPFHIGQKFGESKACSNPDKTEIVSELPNGLCPEGKVRLYPLLGLTKGHTGIDLFAPDGAVILAPCDGVVKETQLEAARGLGVGIITKDRRDLKEHGEHYAKVRQWHGKKILVSLGQEVKVGDPVMIADNTGYSAGSHNHFELKPVEYDPQENHFNVFQDNGFFGCVDPLPFFNRYYADQAQSVLAGFRAIIAFLQSWLTSR